MTDTTQTSSAADSKPEAKPTSQKPSMGRIVIMRDTSGNSSPAIITRVFDDGSIALHVFRDDAAGGPTFDTHGEVKADGEGPGWHWPTKV